MLERPGPERVQPELQQLMAGVPRSNEPLRLQALQPAERQEAVPLVPFEVQQRSATPAAEHRR